MGVFKFAAVLALLSIPILLIQKEEQAPQIVESDEIFDEELTID